MYVGAAVLRLHPAELQAWELKIKKLVGKDMDLVALLEHVPPLLDACLLDNVAAVRRMRLVKKEASRVALLALKSYTLKLKGSAKDTNVGGARLLQHAHLQHLTVQLHLTGGHTLWSIESGAVFRVCCT